MTRKTPAAPRKTSTAAAARVPAPERATPADLDTGHFAELLDERIGQAREKIASVVADIREVTLAAKDTPADDEHDPEGSTVTVERNNEMALLAAGEESLRRRGPAPLSGGCRTAVPLVTAVHGPVTGGARINGGNQEPRKDS